MRVEIAIIAYDVGVVRDGLADVLMAHLDGHYVQVSALQKLALAHAYVVVPLYLSRRNVLWRFVLVDVLAVLLLLVPYGDGEALILLLLQAPAVLGALHRL
jgi:hypothetical protein